MDGLELGLGKGRNLDNVLRLVCVSTAYHTTSFFKCTHRLLHVRQFNYGFWQGQYSLTHTQTHVNNVTRVSLFPVVANVGVKCALEQLINITDYQCGNSVCCCDRFILTVQTKQRARSSSPPTIYRIIIVF